MAVALERMRKICSALPNTSEGTHFGKSAFKVAGQMFATCGEEDGRWQVVVGLPAAQLKELLEEGGPYSRYPRAAGALAIAIDASTDWKEVGRLVEESYRMRAPKPKEKKKKAR